MAAIADADLHAFVDGELSGRALDAVRRHLAADEAAAARVMRWRMEREALRASLAGVAAEPVPLRLRVARIEPGLTRRREERRQFLFALGFIAGFLLGLGVAAGVVLAPRLF